MIEEGIVARLYAASGVTALVGGAGIYPVLLPKGAQLPALTYQRVSDVTQMTMDASPNIRLVRSRFQFDAWANGVNAYTQVRQLEKAVCDVLQDFNGTLDD